MGAFAGLKGRIGHGGTGRIDGAAAEQVLAVLKAVAKKFGDRIEDEAGFVDYFGADAVTGQKDNFGVHAKASFFSAGWAAPDSANS